MEEPLRAPLDRLRASLSELGSALVLLSGGVDSALLARVAAEELGDRTLALTVAFEAIPDQEVTWARQLAADLGLAHEVARGDLLSCESFTANPRDRCYHCKARILALAESVRRRHGLRWIVDGTNTSDDAADRPGMRAAREAGVRHPHREAGLDKTTIRALARELGLEAWDRPSAACLATRLPAGTRITADKLARTNAAERALHELGLRQVRVRWHELAGARVMARIEVAPPEFASLLDPHLRSRAVTACRRQGFDLVTLDLVGYRGDS